MHHPARRELILDRIFVLGIWLKGIDGLLEIVGGLLLLWISPATLNQFVIALTQHELVEDPHDVIATALRRVTSQMAADTRLLASLYLAVHGLVKLALVLGLLRGRRWAYPAAIAFLSLFIIYQLYRLSYHASAGLLLLTLFDMAVVALTWREYRFHASRTKARASAKENP